MLRCGKCGKELSNEEYQAGMSDITKNGDNSKNISYDCPYCGCKNEVVI